MSRTSALGIVAPDGKEGMQAHAAQFAARGIPFLFDPGQGLPLFSGAELAAMIDAADLSRRQRLRGEAAVRAHRLVDRRHRRARRRADRDAGRRGLDHPRRRRDLRDSGGAPPTASSIPPAAATRIAPACCTASPPAGIGSAPDSSPRCWARSRSAAAAGRITSSTATIVAERYRHAFGERLWT